VKTTRIVSLVVLVSLLAVSFAAFGLVNPTGPDDQPYFSDAAGVQKTCFSPGESVYVAYFDTTVQDYNNSVGAADTMYVSVAAQGTENFANGGWDVDVSSGTIADAGDIGAVPGDSATDTQTFAVGGPNASILALVETGLDTGLFIADVGASTPIVIVAGDLVTVGLTANDQDAAYVQALFLGWLDSITTPDPGNAGSYGAGDDIVVTVTAESANTFANASASLYYRINGAAWQSGTWTDKGGAYPDRILELTAPGTIINDTIDVLWQPGIDPNTGGCSTTPALATTIVDQPVDLADATFPGGGAPTNTSTGFVRDYMTINAANAAVVGIDYWIGVHAAPAVLEYDYRLDTFPIIINDVGLTVMGGPGALPVVDARATAASVFELRNTATLDYLHIKGADDQRVVLVTPSGDDAGYTVGAQGTYTVKNCILEVNYAANFGSGIDFEYTAFPNSDLVATDNTIRAGDGTATGAATDGTWGIRLHGGGDCVITGNSIHNIYRGIQTFGWPLTTLDISNNDFSNIKTTAIWLSSEAGNVDLATFTLAYNIFSAVGQGVYLLEPTALGGIFSNTLALRYNKFDNADAYTVALDSFEAKQFIGYAVATSNVAPAAGEYCMGTGDISGIVDATLNWWGSTAGPTIAVSNADGDGDAIDDGVNVNYRPWLNGVPVCGIGVVGTLNMDATYQGNKTVQANSWYWTINQALAAANVPCVHPSIAPCQSVTIDVGPGTYAEEIVYGYDNIRDTVLRSTGGKAVTNIEAGVDTTSIIQVGASQSLHIGVDGADLGFTIYFDTGAVPTPGADKILHLGSTLDIFGCMIDATTKSGIHVDSVSATGTIKDNVINGCDEYGIWLEKTAGMTIDGNTIQFNPGGGILVDANGNTIGVSGNSILNNTGDGLVINGQGNTVAGNTIHNNGLIGIDVTGINNLFNTNQITSNGNQGVRLTAAASGNVFNVGDTVPNTNCIFDNDSDGSNNYEQMENLNTGENVDATNNYWGSASGPFNAMRNASGDMNNRVSDFVLIEPWAITCAGGMADATISLNCGAGWYLTSIPLDPADPVAENVYGELPIFAAYKWNPGTGQYDDLTGVDINWDDGYWLWLMGDETVTVEGAAVTTDETYTLGNTGWQQFSIPAIDIPVTGPDEGGRNDPDILFCAPGGVWYTYNDAIANGLILPGIFYYNTCNGAYDPAMGADSVLDPWNGYWIETLVNGVEVSIPVAYWIANPWVASRSFRPMSIKTDGRTPPAPPALPKNLQAALDEETGIVVTNEPNPIRDVHTTTFKVKSAVPIEAILVEIFNQAGQLVFQDEQLGDELAWHTDNCYGEYLANGVYLYRVSALIHGEWVLTDVRKLAIYR